MRKTKYAVTLTEDERAQLRTLIGQGVAPVRRACVEDGLEAALTHKTPDRTYTHAPSKARRKPAWLR